MKIIFLVVFFVYLLTACQKEEIRDYCWQCESIIYGKTIVDYICYPMITDIKDYKNRLYEFYDGSITNINCILLPEE